MIDPRQRDILQALQKAGPSSRWELHELTGQTPNRVGTVVQSLIDQKLVRERDPEPQRLGRPRVPLEIDPAGRHLIGLSINPDGFDLCRLGLTGELLKRVASERVDSATLIKSAAKSLAAAVNEETLGVGLTLPGFFDAESRTLLFSSVQRDAKPVSLRPLDKAAGDVPVVLGNDMQALAARWSLAHQAAPAQDVLLVWFDDGRMGSAFLAGGRPYRGCLSGANELGHTRFFVKTARCFCGQTGCLERIVSTDFLQRQGGRKQTLADRAAKYVKDEVSLRPMLQYLCGGLSNAVNFLRPHRLVLVSPLATQAAFRDAVIRGTSDLLLSPLKAATAIEFWDQPAAEAAENAAWLATAELLWTGWDAAASSETDEPKVRV